MNRLEFINELGAALSALPPDEVQKALSYYVESIDDRMEDGMSEEEAIASLGAIPELAENILAQQEQEPLHPPVAPEPTVEFIISEPETPVIPPAKKRIPAWAIVLLILGSPVWLSLGLGAVIVALALYITAWALLGSLVIIAGALIVGGIFGVPMSFLGTVFPNTMPVRILSCGFCLLMGGLGFALLPSSLFLIRGFCKGHSLLFQKLTIRKEASK